MPPVNSKPSPRDIYAFSFAEGWRTLKALWPWRFLVLSVVTIGVIVVAAALELWWVAAFVAPALVMLLMPVVTPQTVKDARQERARAFRDRHYGR